MDIPLSLLDSVIFLEVKDGDLYKPIGTAFVINEKENDKLFLYYVTCRHVIQAYLDTKVQIFARLNLLETNGVEHVPLYTKWIFHEDDGHDLVDIAVLPIENIPGVQKNRVLALSSSLIYGREGMKQHFQRDLQVGDDFVFAGLFQNYSGHGRNFPVVRFGKVALITDEKLPGVEPWLGLSDYFLVESQAYPGMSGSPVFVMKPYQGMEKYFLIGVMAGYYYEDELLDRKFTHFGISQVVPIEGVGDIIWGEQLRRDREIKSKSSNL